MQAKALNDVIREMAARVDSIHPHEENSGHAAGFPADIEAYMAVDSLLANLYKQFLNARRNRLRVFEKMGEKSLMASIISDQVDSARCAVETRLIELASDPVKRRMTERLKEAALRQQLEEEEQDKNETLAYARRLARQNQVDTPVQQETFNDFFAVLVLWMMMSHTLHRATVKLSLAHRFTAVSTENGLRRMQQVA